MRTWAVALVTLLLISCQSVQQRPRVQSHAPSPENSKSTLSVSLVDAGPHAPPSLKRYLEAVLPAIKESLLSSGEDTILGLPFTVDIGCNIFKNGSVADFQIYHASGSPAFDNAVQRAIASASPFPPLPTDVTVDHVNVTFHFKTKKETPPSQ